MVCRPQGHLLPRSGRTAWPRHCGISALEVRGSKAPLTTTGPHPNDQRIPTRACANAVPPHVSAPCATRGVSRSGGAFASRHMRASPLACPRRLLGTIGGSTTTPQPTLAHASDCSSRCCPRSHARASSRTRRLASVKSDSFWRNAITHRVSRFSQTSRSNHAAASRTTCGSNRLVGQAPDVDHRGEPGAAGSGSGPSSGLVLAHSMTAERSGARRVTGGSSRVRAGLTSRRWQCYGARDADTKPPLLSWMIGTIATGWPETV